METEHRTWKDPRDGRHWGVSLYSTRTSIGYQKRLRTVRFMSEGEEHQTPVADGVWLLALDDAEMAGLLDDARRG